jgi:hypothetical protein
MSDDYITIKIPKHEYPFMLECICRGLDDLPSEEPFVINMANFLGLMHHEEYGWLSDEDYERVTNEAQYI